MKDNFLAMVEMKARLQHSIDEAVQDLSDFETKLNEMQDFDIEERHIMLSLINEFKIAMVEWIIA